MYSELYHILKYLRKIFLVLSILIITNNLLAQQIPTRHFTMKEGLPSMGIRCIFKDSRGLIWIGTDAGLCNYDGKEFTIVNASSGMTANNIWSIAEDEHGTMWFGSFGDGLYKFNGQKFDHFTKKDGLVDDQIRVLCYSKNFHCLIVGSNNGISTVRGKWISKSPAYLGTSQRDYCVTGIMDVGKFIYISTYAGNNPIRYFPDQNKFITVNDSGVNYPGYSFGCYLSVKGDTIFEAGSLGVQIIKKDTTILNKTLGQVFGYTEDNSGNLWFAAWSYSQKLLEGGIFKYDGKSFKNYKTAFGITDIEIWAVFFDKEQEILWVGTLNEGLFMIPYSPFSEYDAAYFKLKKLKIKSLLVDAENALWIADESTLIRRQKDDSYTMLDTKFMLQSCRKLLLKNYNLAYYHYNTNINQLIRSNNTRDWDGLNYNNLSEDKNGKILFSNKFGLFSFDQKKGNINYLRASLPDDITILGNDTLIVSGWGPTLLIPDYKTRPLVLKYIPDSVYKRSIPPRNVNRVVKNNGRVWYASWINGLWMSEGLNFINFNKTDSSISNNLTDICFDDYGKVIFGSNTGEICIATLTANKLRIRYRINNTKGLQGNSISWLINDKKGNLWVGTNLGINRINLAKLYKTGKLEFSFFDDEEGYSGHASKLVVFDREGNLWIGADDRLIKMEHGILNSFHANAGKITLKNIEINHRQYEQVITKGINPWTSIPEGEFSLNHTENNIVFYYDVFNYLNPEKDRFRYFLEGYDEKWSAWSKTRRAIYTNLPPGRYILHIESYNINLGNKTRALIITFRIRNPWWKLWYVQLFTVLLAIAVILMAIRQIILQAKLKERQKAEIEKKLVQLEIQALQAQMNPHFIFNTINSIQSFVLSNNMDAVLSYLSDFAKVVRASLANVTKKVVPLTEEIDFLNSYLRIEKMRFPEKFEFTVQTSDNTDAISILIPPYLVQPFAENAVRHGFMHKKSKGHLSILFEMVECNIIKCTITDNGIGRKKAREIDGLNTEPARPHSSVITENRIRLFNPAGQQERYKVVYTDLADSTGKAIGLKVEVYLPVECD